MSTGLRIAVIGSGISGLVSAYLLQQKHEVTLFEKEAVIGGHSRTLEVIQGHQSIPVDTGFIVFNKDNYPTLCKLFEQLEVPSKDSCMSFGVSLENGRIEYGTVPIENIFAQGKNLLSIKHWQMLFDIRRFNREAEALLVSSNEPSLGEFLAEKKYSQAFISRFLIPMAASIWSTSPTDIEAFPAKHLIKFFANHGLLDPKDRKKWRTVCGGSKEYINRLLTKFTGDIKTDVKIRQVVRAGAGIELHHQNGEVEKYDQVVLACHSDQALELLGNSASKEEKGILGDIGYQPNTVILHSDETLMPKNKECWQSWNFLSESNTYGEKRVCLSYWMNRLQSIQSEKPLIVSLNPDRKPKESLIEDIWLTGHPVFNQAALNAQARLSEIQGVSQVWFAGAWQSYGFHEDGALSGLRVAQALGCDL